MRDPYFRKPAIKSCSASSVYTIRVLFGHEETLDTDILGKIIDIENMRLRRGYVYDFTTENHHFSAGIGTIVVHNTDSVFLRLTTDPVTKERSLVKGA
jgi:hypothetical protein